MRKLGGERGVESIHTGFDFSGAGGSSLSEMTAGGATFRRVGIGWDFYAKSMVRYKNIPQDVQG